MVFTGFCIVMANMYFSMQIWIIHRNSIQSPRFLKDFHKTLRFMENHYSFHGVFVKVLGSTQDFVKPFGITGFCKPLGFLQVSQRF